MVVEVDRPAPPPVSPAAPAATGAGDPAGHLYLTCTLAGRRYLVPMAPVREVEEIGAITLVPGTPGWMRGVMNLRGTIVAIVDLAHLLGLAAESGAGTEALICARSLYGEEITLGLAIDAVTTIRSLAPDDLLPLPEQPGAARSTVARHLLGVARGEPGGDDGLLGVIDLPRLLDLLVAEQMGAPDQGAAAGE
jgi:purine-binding chemotaxis protein CheW